MIYMAIYDTERCCEEASPPQSPGPPGAGGAVSSQSLRDSLPLDLRGREERLPQTGSGAHVTTARATPPTLCSCGGGAERGGDGASVKSPPFSPAFFIP